MHSLKFGFIPILPLAKNYPTDPFIFSTKAVRFQGRFICEPRTRGPLPTRPQCRGPHQSMIFPRAVKDLKWAWRSGELKLFWKWNRPENTPVQSTQHGLAVLPEARVSITPEHARTWVQSTCNRCFLLGVKVKRTESHFSKENVWRVSGDQTDRPNARWPYDPRKALNLSEPLLSIFKMTTTNLASCPMD